MEENKKTTKSKLRAYLPIIILGVAMIASAIGLGIAAINKNTDKMANAGFMTLEEIDQLEDLASELTEEEIAELKEKAKNGVEDELTLRLLLLLDDEIEIKVSNNMELLAGMKVNGTKTLTGKAVLKMFLGSERNTKADGVLMVVRGNTLNVEGLVLDGNGVCNAVSVQEGATLNYNDGTIQYGSPYGIHNLGTTYVNGGTLTKCMAAGIGVESGSKTYVEGGTLEDNYKNHIWSAAGSVVEVTGGVFDHSYSHAIHNIGTLTMTGGTIKNSNTADACAVANFGKAYIDGGNDYIEISNCVTGFFSEKDTMEVNKVYGHDIVKNFLRIKEGKGKVTNCKIEDTGTYAVRAGGEVTIENIYAENLGTHGIYTSPGKVTVKNVEVKNAKQYGFVNCGGDVVATDITITGAGTSAFINYDSTLNGKGEKGLLTLKDCTATDCNTNLMVRCGTIVKVSDCVFNKTKRTNVHMTEGRAELTNVKLLGSTDADCSIVSIRKDAKATLKNVEMAYGNRGISLAGEVTVIGGSIHDNKGELAGNAVRTEDNAVFKLEGVKIYNNHNTSEKMAGGVAFMTKGSHGTIIGCEITNNSSVRTVGGIYAENAELNIRDTEFKKNKTTGPDGDGGAILLEKSKSIIRGCTFEENSSGTDYQNVGGAIYSKAGSDLQIINCEFNKNEAGRGGAIANVGTLTIKEGTKFTGNTCTEGGAGVYNGGNGVVTDTGSTYEQNKLTEEHAGGAIRNDGANTQYKLVDATLKENSSKGDGGAIYSNGLVFVATRCTFDGNFAQQGGAAYINTTSAAKNPIEANGDGFALSATDCVFVNNKSTEKKENTLGGGALYFTGTGLAILQNNNYESAEANKYDNAYFKGNHAEVEGGAIVVGGDVDLTLRGYKFAENTSNLNSAAIYVKGKLTDWNGYYYKNTVTCKDASKARGGAIQCHLYNSIAKVTFTNTVFEENSTPGDGGAIYSNGNSINIEDCTFNKNIGRHGGALYVNLQYGKLNGKDCVFTNNVSDVTADKNNQFGGGAVYLAGKYVEKLDNVATLNNSAKGTDGTFDYTKAYFNSNSTNGGGGAIVVASGVKFNVKGYKFASNHAGKGAGALYNNGAVTDTACVYDANTTANVAGAVRNYGDAKNGIEATFTKIGGAFYNNEAVKDGSAMEFNQISKATLKDVIFDEASHKDESGNCLYINGDATLNLDNVKMKNIGTGKNYHAIYNNGGNIQMAKDAKHAITIDKVSGHGIVNMAEGTIEINGVSIQDVTGEERHAVYSESGSVKLSNVAIKDITKDARDAIYVKGGTATIEDATIENINRAAITATDTTDKTTGKVTAVGEVTLKNVTVKLPEGAKEGAKSAQYGIYCVRGKVNVDNVNMANTGSTKDEKTAKDSHAVLNNGGTIITAKDATKTIKVVDTTGYGIANIGNGTIEIKGVTLQDVAQKGISSEGGTVKVDDVVIKNAADGVYLNDKTEEKTGEITVINACIEGVTRGIAIAKGKVIAEVVDVKKSVEEGARVYQYGVYVYGNDSTAELKQVTVEDATVAGVYTENGTVLADVLTIKRGVRGIHSKAGKLGTEEKAMKTVSIQNTTDHSLQSESGTVYVEDIDILDGNKKGIVIQSGSASIIDATIDRTAQSSIFVGAVKGGTGAEVSLDEATITNCSVQGIEVSGGSLITTDNAVTVEESQHGIFVQSGTADMKNLVVKKPTNAAVKITGGELKGQITVTPTNYTENATIVSRGDNVTASTLATVSGLVNIQQEENSSDKWAVDSKGLLQKACAQLVATGKYYTSLESAISAANAGEGADEINLLTDYTVGSAITITSDITLTPTKAVTITGKISGNLFKINKGAILKAIGTDVNTITLQGSNATTLIYNSGTANLQHLVLDTAKRALITYQGSTMATHVSVKNWVEHGTKIADSSSSMTLTDVVFDNANNLAANNVYGVEVENGTANLIRVAVNNVSATGKVACGVKVSAGTVTLTNVNVDGVNSDTTGSHGISVTGGTVTVTDTSVKNVSGHKDNYGFNVTGGTVTVNGTNGLTVEEIQNGHGISLTGGSFGATKVTVKNAKRAGIYVANISVTIGVIDEISSLTFTSGVYAHFGIKSATVTVGGKSISNGSTTKYYELSSFK